MLAKATKILRLLHIAQLRDLQVSLFVFTITN